MASPDQLKVSYCTTCMGRLKHLRETLPKNLKAEKDNQNVEFVVLSYGKDPELDAYIRDNFQAEMDSGRLKYVVYPEAKYFQMAHAKNMAHRMASGDILVNLDADNVIADGYAEWLQKQFLENPRSITTQGAIATRIKGLVNRKDAAGMRGRIALSANDFTALGGYDEKFSHHGGDDNDLVLRAQKQSIAKVAVPIRLFGDVIEHSNEERFQFMSSKDQEISKRLIERSTIKKLSDRIKRNLVEPAAQIPPESNVGCGIVYVNFSEEPTVIMTLNSEDKVANIYTRVLDSAALKKDWVTTVKNNKDTSKSVQSHS